MIKLKEILQKKKLNEGPPKKYAKEYKALEKIQNQYYKAMINFAKKMGGEGYREEAKHLEYYYNKYVRWGWQEYLKHTFFKELK